MITVILVDDDALTRRTLRDILAPEDDIRVVGEYADGSPAIAAARSLGPKVVILDIHMPHLDGIETTRLLTERAPETAVLILAAFAGNTDIYRALEAGARGFIFKDDPPELIVTAVRVVASGASILAPAVMRSMIGEHTRIHSLGGDTRELLATLTAREKQILMHIGFGRSNSDIATELKLSEETVKTHVGRVLAKLGVNRVQAAIVAVKAGLSS